MLSVTIHSSRAHRSLVLKVSGKRISQRRNELGLSLMRFLHFLKEFYHEELLRMLRGSDVNWARCPLGDDGWARGYTRARG